MHPLAYELFPGQRGIAHPAASLRSRRSQVVASLGPTALSPSDATHHGRVAFATYSEQPECSSDDRLALAALRRAGVDAVPAVWDSGDAVWREFDMVVLRSTWDYFRRPAEFLAWVDRVAMATELWNPPEQVRWNYHKRYLLELERAGVDIVPTELVPEGGAASLSAILHRRGWHRVVVKPAVGGNAFGLLRVDSAETAEGQRHLEELLRSGDALVQPLMERTEDRGERSLVFLDGRFAHAAEYRSVLRENPRVARPFQPDAREIEIARRTFAFLRPTPLYARLDYLPEGDAGWRLGELEIVEPELFFTGNSASVDAFTSACLERLERARARASASAPGAPGPRPRSPTEAPAAPASPRLEGG